MARFSGTADRDAVEREMPYADRDLPATLYGFLTRVRDAHGGRNAVSFQLLAEPGAKAESLTWDALHRHLTGPTATLESG